MPVRVDAKGDRTTTAGRSTPLASTRQFNAFGQELARALAGGRPAPLAPSGAQSPNGPTSFRRQSIESPAAGLNLPRPKSATLRSGLAGQPTDRAAIGRASDAQPGRLRAAGSGRARAGTGPARALALAEYPRPVGDTRRGLHWIPTLYSTPAVVDRFVREAVEMKAKWVVLLNEGTQIGANDYLVQQLTKHGIMPIMRIYTPGGAPIQGDVEALVRHYRALGVQYYQLYNEPNLRSENQGADPNPTRFVDRWLPAARAVVAAGGLPGLAPLAPGGDYDDLGFLRQALAEVKARGELGVFDRAWIGIHNYTLNHPIDYTKDSNGFLKFRWYDRIVREQLGRSLPIIGTEGGTFVGQQNDRTLPAVSEPRQVKMVVDAYKYMRRAEPYFFAHSYWVIANEAGGGHDPAWRDQALFRPDGTSPIVPALKALA